jgi:pilus assembly protein CpaF
MGGGGMTVDVVDRVRRRLAESGVPPRRAALAPVLRAEAGALLDNDAFLELLRQTESEVSGAGPLEPLLAEPGTTDVLVNAPDDVWVECGAGLERTTIRFPDESSVRRLAQRLAAAAGRRLDDSSPWVDGALPDGTRLHAVLPPVAARGTCLSLRLFRPRGFTLDQFAMSGTLTPSSAAIVSAVIRARLAFLVTGGTGSGKTTMLSTLLGLVRPEERLVVVEDAAEIQSRHPHLVRLVARAPNVEGAGEVTLRDLVRQALRMRPDRLVVGEVRGPEVIDLLTALNTGHEGGAGTVHANSAAELPARLEALAALGGLGRAELHSLLASAVQVVLHLHRDRAGRRLLAEIAVLRRLADLVRVEPAWRRDGGAGPAWKELAALLGSRGVEQVPP